MRPHPTLLLLLSSLLCHRVCAEGPAQKESENRHRVSTIGHCVVVMGLNVQEAGRLLVHMEGAQVSGDQTDRRGEAVDLAGTGSKHRRSTVSMETMDEEARITNSHAKEDQAHMQGGRSAYARRAKHRQEEDQAQGACRRVLLVRGRTPETWVCSVVLRWLGTISIDTTVMLTPRSGVSVDDDEVDGVGDKVGGVGGNSVASTRVSSVLTDA
ncbi:uncharacterized protein UHOD_11850 [Ustilago sp. UG-2017b]|nr:uncharacterized protein UHOD_11850 [Ustilago sp. UG-2017b]